MRRFIVSLLGKAIGQLVILTLVLPSITLALYKRADAQVAVLPLWAVTEFKNLKSPGTGFGKTASTAVSSELGKIGTMDVIPDESLKRSAENLGISMPPDGVINLMRLGQEVKASTIISGEIVNYQVRAVGGGKQASVALRVVVYDVASSLPVNGAAQQGVSTVRAGSVSDETLIDDAIAQAASEAIRSIHSRALPFGTILNTQANKALVNKGARAGFQPGQDVVIIRGSDQVATGHVSDVEPDSSYVVSTQLIKGIQPGDKVRVIFKIPELVLEPNGTTRTVLPKNRSFPSGLVSVLLVVGLIAALVGGGNGGSQDTVTDVTAQATISPTNGPAVLIGWSPNGFAGGNSQRAAWQIFRSDQVVPPISPVGVQGGLYNDWTDTETPRPASSISYAYFNGTIGGQVCNYASPTDTTNSAIIPGITAGTPYSYQVQEVYELLSIDLPGGGVSSSTGTGTGTTGTGTGTTGTGTGTTGTGTGTTGTGTGTTGTGTGTTGTGTGTTGTGTGTGNTVCYFLSTLVSSTGYATPLNLPTLVAPTNKSTLSGTTATNFTLNSVQVNSPISVQYVLEFSTTPNFAKGTYVQAASFISNAGGVVGPTTGINPSTFFPNATANTTIYWRYGARNAYDIPGPAPDHFTHERYVFSNYWTFTFTGSPPPPPKGTKSGVHTAHKVSG